MSSAKQDNVTEINAIHCGNLQLRSSKTLLQPAIEEIIDEPVQKSTEETKITPTPIEQTLDTTQYEPDPPSSVGVVDLPQEEEGQSPTESLKIR